MSEDPDFDMEVVEDNELDELGADGASSSDMRPASQTVRKGEDTTEEGGSKMEVKETEEPGTLTSGKGSDRKKTASGRSAEKYMTDPGATQLERDAFGSLPSGWEYGKTGEWLQYIRSGISESQNQDEEGIPVTRIETISDGTVDYEKVGYVDLDPEEAKADRLKSGDLLFSNINSREQIGKTAVYKEEGTLYHGMNLLRLRYVDDVLKPLFAYYLYDSPMAKDIFFRLSQAAVGQSSINQGQLKNLSLPRPPLPEQRKIASVLYAVDQAIQKTEAIIEQAKRVKRGLMQDLFHGRHKSHDEYQSTPVGEVPSHWDVESIGSVVEMAQYGISESMSGSGEYPIFRMNNIENGYMIDEPMKYIDLDEDEFEKYRVEKQDILFNRTNSLELVGKTGIFELEGDYVFASYLVRLRANDRVDPHYLNYYMNSYEGQNRMMDFATKGVSQANINANSIQQVKCPVPPKNEQTEIVSQLRAIDQEIEHNKVYVSQLRPLKTGLMQDLLTGEVRTMYKAIEVLDEVKAHG